MKKYLNTNFGRSVRSFFEKDIKSFEESLICLLPEWICYDMTKSVQNLHIHYDFYSVKSFKKSNYFLEIDSDNLKNKIYLYKKKYDKIVVVLAYPMGYYDQNIEIFLNEFDFRKQKQIVPLLDLSQGYGFIDFSKQILKSFAAYVSFNGNKLINTSGAIRIFSSKLEENDSYQKFIKQAYIEVEKQKISFINAFSNIEKDLKKCLSKQLQRFNIENNIISYHRTAIILDNLSLSDIALLEESKYGQKLHPNPQYDPSILSDNYMTWFNNVFLIFSKQRV